MSWGTNYAIYKLLLSDGVSVLYATIVISFGSLVLLGGICARRGRWMRLTWHTARFYLMSTIFGYLYPMACGLTVASYVSVVDMALLTATGPLFTYVLATLFGVEKLQLKRVAAILAGFFAVTILLLTESESAPRSVGWLLFAGTIPLSYAFYHTLVVWLWPRDMDPWQAAFGDTAASLVIVAPVTLLFAGGHLEWQTGGAQSNLLLVWLVVISAVEIYLYFFISRSAGAVTVSVTNYISISTSIFIAWLLFDDTISITIIPVATVVLLAVRYVSRGGSGVSDT